MNINFGEKWKNFGESVFDPFSIVSIAIMVVLGFALRESGQDAVPSVLLTILFSISAGIAGAILQKRYEDKSEQKLIFARGKSALRNLVSISMSLRKMQGRVQEVSDVHEKAKSLNRKLIVANLQEIFSGIDLIFLHIFDSIDNWQDLLPEPGEEEKALLLLLDERNKYLEEYYQLSKRENLDAKELQKIKTRIEEIEASSIGRSSDARSISASLYGDLLMNLVPLISNIAIPKSLQHELLHNIRGVKKKDPT